MSVEIHELAALDDADIEKTACLIQQIFGFRGDEEVLLRTWQQETHRCVRIAKKGDVIVGLAVLTVAMELDRTKYETPFRVDLGSIPTPVAEFNQILIEPRYRQQGLASQLAASVIEWVSSKSVGYIIGVSWQHGQPGHSGRLFERGGFRKLGECKGFYRQFHEQSAQRCTVCRGTCNCIAILYGITRNDLLPTSRSNPD